MQQERVNMAVIDLEGKGISQLEASTLSDRLRTSLVMTGKVTVLERGRMEEILSETGFQQTGCVSTECAVEVGKILGVTQILSGNIGKIGKTFTIDVQIVDVETSKILRVSSKDYTGEVDGLLNIMRDMAFKLVADEPSPGMVGVVEILSIPPNATVYIDDIMVGITPVVLDELKAGDHTLRLTYSGHTDFRDSFTLMGGETRKIEGVLEKLNILTATTTPANNISNQLEKDPCLQASIDVEQDINGTLWFGAGCLFGVLGWGAAYAIEPSPPVARLVGKSPEYVATYIDCYKMDSKNIQKKQSLNGCLTYAGAYLLLMLLAGS